MGSRKQLHKDGLCQDGFVGMLEKTESVPMVLPCLAFTNKRGEVLRVQVDGEQIFRDDLTGQLLKPELVRAARAKVP